MKLRWDDFRHNLVAWTDFLLSEAKYPQKSSYYGIQPGEYGNEVDDLLLADRKKWANPSQLAN